MKAKVNVTLCASIEFFKTKVELIFEHLLIGNNLWNWSTSTLCTDLHELPIILSLTASRFSSYFLFSSSLSIAWVMVHYILRERKKITKSLNEPDCFWNTFLYHLSAAAVSKPSENKGLIIYFVQRMFCIIFVNVPIPQRKCSSYSSW